MEVMPIGSPGARIQVLLGLGYRPRIVLRMAVRTMILEIDAGIADEVHS
jgi:hypothetical protein